MKLITKSERIFVAGSNGMAGSAIVKKLELCGYGSKKLGGKILTPSSKELDLMNLNQTLNWFEENKPTVVVLAAAKVGGILANASYPADFILNNLKIQTNVIETSWKFNIKRFIFLGSSCIYPKHAPQPIVEDYLLSSNLEQTNESYALAKIAGLKLCHALRIQYGFDAITLMPTNLYGPKDNYKDNDSHVMASLIKKFSLAVKFNYDKVICWGSGKPLREFMHVDDLADAVVFALENWDPSSKKAPKDKEGKPLTYLNVGTGKEISIKLLAEEIAKLVDYKGNIIWDKSKPDGTLRKNLSIEKFKKLGWSPKIKLSEGLKMTLKNFQVEQDNKFSQL